MEKGMVIIENFGRLLKMTTSEGPTWTVVEWSKSGLKMSRRRA